MSKERKTRWFLEPKGGDTNESAMEDLAKVCGATDDQIHRSKLDGQDRPHDVVEVPHAFITRMWRSKRKFNFSFAVFYQKEGETRMHLWRFSPQDKVRRTRAVKDMEQKIRTRIQGAR